MHLLPLARRDRRAVDLPRGVRDGRRRGRGRRLAARSSRATRGLAEVAAGLEEEYPERVPRPRVVRVGRQRGPRAKLGASLALPPAEHDALRRAARQAVVERWSWHERRASVSFSLSEPRGYAPAMGEEQRVSWQELLATSHAAFEGGTDLTLAVEEEFALLDPESLELTDRFEELYAAALETDLAPNIVGELIASEVEVRTGKCAELRRGGRRDARAARAAARASRAELKIGLGGTGYASVEPLAGPADHRHAALPAERRAPPLRRLAQQHLRPARARRHRRRRPCDRRARRAAQLPARAARAVGQLAVRRGCRTRPALGAHRDLHAHVPALRDPRRVRRLARLGGLRLVPLPHRLDHRAHADLVERPAAPRVPDRRDPHLRRPARPRRGAVARGARLRAGRAVRARLRRRRAAARSGRTGCSRRTSGGRSATASPASCSTSSAASRSPPGARIEQLLEWVAPGRGRDRRGAVPRGPRAERRRAPDRALRRRAPTCAGIYAEQVQAGEPIGG